MRKKKYVCRRVGMNNNIETSKMLYMKELYVFDFYKMSRKHRSSENRDENSEITRVHAHSANIGTNAHIIRTVCQYFIYFVFRENFPTINHKRAKTAYREECCFSTSVEGGKKRKVKSEKAAGP